MDFDFVSIICSRGIYFGVGEMNLASEIVSFSARCKPIPKPYYVVSCDGHYIVCELDENYNLIKECSSIHRNKWTVRRWAFEIAKEKAAK